jgi:hypothetical protein
MAAKRRLFLARTLLSSTALVVWIVGPLALAARFQAVRDV